MKLHSLAVAMIALLSSGCDNKPKGRQVTMDTADANSDDTPLLEYAEWVVGKMPGGDRVNGSDSAELRGEVVNLVGTQLFFEWRYWLGLAPFNDHEIE